ncbi:hypothetical protein LXA43DRAFT_757701 [Ganoderma leucocontextum]|nr:hypothetical protein LXA43DRAFT_757701 [Ganoderma leucocontextum]
MTEGSTRYVEPDLRGSVVQESGTTLSTNGADDKTAGIGDLPAELFHNILDLLHCTDHGTLTSCTLVCHGWLDISRRHLFSELHVLRSCDETFQSLVDWIEQHAIHAGYIRTLSLESRLVSVPPQVSLMASLALDTLSRLLRILPNLQGLRLHQLKIKSPTPSPTTSPTSDSPSGRYSIGHMEYEKCLCELSRTFELLSWFHIDHLDFDPLFLDAKDATMQPGDYTLDVRSLCVSPLTEDPLVAFQALQQVVRPNMLRSFRYPSPGLCPTPLPVVDFLRDVGQRIVDLNLCPSAEDDYLVLPQLPSLQVFRYHTCVPFLCSPAKLSDHEATFAPFKDSWILHLPADLEQLIIYLPYGEPVLPPGPNSTVLWELESALQARFRVLKKLSFIFPELPCDLASVAAAAAACFPTFHERGVLEVTVRNWELECREWNIYGYLHDR